MNINPWEKTGTEPIFGNNFVKLEKITFKNPRTGEERPFAIFNQQKPPGATILALTEDNQVITIREFFQGANEIIRLLPSGGAFDGEKPEEVAKRELLEETGYKAGDLIYLGWIYREPRNAPIKSYLFLALDCIKISSGKLDSSEEIEVSLIPWHNWKNMISDENIHEPAAIVATHLALIYI